MLPCLSVALALDYDSLWGLHMNDAERLNRLATLSRFRDQGELAYDSMYKAHSFSAANGYYSDAKEFFHEAIRLAEELGEVNEAISLGNRLEHIKAVFRNQFVQ